MVNTFVRPKTTDGAPASSTSLLEKNNLFSGVSLCTVGARGFSYRALISLILNASYVSYIFSRGFAPTSNESVPRKSRTFVTREELVWIDCEPYTCFFFKQTT